MPEPEPKPGGEVPPVPTIAVGQLLPRLDHGEDVVILDVRNDEEFRDWKLEGRRPVPTVHLPYFDFIGLMARYMNGTQDREPGFKIARADRFLIEAGSDNTYLQNDLGLEVMMSGALGLRVAYQVRYNTEVPPGIRKTDTLTTIGLLYETK